MQLLWRCFVETAGPRGGGGGDLRSVSRPPPTHTHTNLRQPGHVPPQDQPRLQVEWPLVAIARFLVSDLRLRASANCLSLDLEFVLVAALVLFANFIKRVNKKISHSLSLNSYDLFLLKQRRSHSRRKNARNRFLCANAK